MFQAYRIAPISLILAPTPVHRLDRVSDDLGIDLWIKRDDLTGFAFGGNKGRKLEYLMAEALSQEAEVIVTCGSVQSNFVRQLGAACSRFGIRCVAAVMTLPFEEAAPDAPALSGTGGNETLDRILDVELHVFPDGTWDELYRHADRLAAGLRAEGRRVYKIPIGGSSALGAFAFVRAAGELADQTGPFEWIVTASSSGSTQTGLSWAFKDTRTRVLGVACDPEPEIVNDFAALAAELDAFTAVRKGLLPGDFEMDFDFVGPGYGVPSGEGDAAVEYLARREGVFLDPVYTGKAFACLVARAKAGDLTGRVLFWHTGGTPSLFARHCS